VIDNSSKDYLANFCRIKKRVEYIASKNIGYGAAHNIAIRKAIEFGSKYHLVLNSDVYFEPNVLNHLIAYMEERNGVAMVQPNIIYPDGSLQYTCRLLPTPANLIFRRFLPKKMVESMNYKYLLKMFDHKSELNVPYHQGSFLFFRTSCFGKVGLFDERFFMYPEDIDITRRMHREYRTMFWPGVTVVHAHRAASYKSKKMLFIHIWNMVKYFNKWGWIIDRERKEWNQKLLKDLN
jgi:GT2 family glycosyltransferase